MPITLHVFPPSPRAFKVLLVANHLALDYQINRLNLAAGDQRSPAYTKLNVHQRMPVLEEEGYVLWESNAISEYLAAKKPDARLMPQELRPRLQVAKWLYWESAHWDPACAIFMFERVVKPLFGMGPTLEAEIERGTKAFGRIAPALEAELQSHRYVAGESLTLADLSIAASFCHAEQARYPLDSYLGIARWLEEMRSLPAWQSTVALQT